MLAGCAVQIRQAPLVLSVVTQKLVELAFLPLSLSPADNFSMSKLARNDISWRQHFHRRASDTAEPTGVCATTSIRERPGSDTGFGDRLSLGMGGAFFLDDVYPSLAEDVTLESRFTNTVGALALVYVVTGALTWTRTS